MSIFCPFGLSHGVSLHGQGKFYEAICQDIDPKNKTIVACFPKDTGLEEACFRIPYDILVVGEFKELALLCLPVDSSMHHQLLKGSDSSFSAVDQAVQPAAAHDVSLGSQYSACSVANERHANRAAST